MLNELLFAGFMPHRYCLRLPELIWTDAISDGVVALSYFLIPYALVRLTKIRKDLTFPWMFLLFAVFILSCGGSHLMDIITLWVAAYRLETGIKVITALTSLPTAILLIRLVPRIAAIPGPQQWQRINKTLQDKIDELETAKRDIWALNTQLEKRVEERTLELTRQNTRLAELTVAWDLSHGIIRGLDGRIRFWCKGNEQLYGWTGEEATGRISHELLQTQFPKPVDEVEAEFLERGTWQGELSHQTATGKRVRVASSWVLQRDESGQPISVVEVNNDLTDRLRALETNALLAAIVESSDDAIFSNSLDGKITSWNRGAERLFGYLKSEIIGQAGARLVPQNERAEEEAILSKIRQGESVEHYETTRFTKNHSKLTVSLVLSPIRSAEGRVIGASAIARDITERKRLEESLRRTNSALAEFAYAAAHDLQEPLRNVALSLQLVKDSSQDGEKAWSMELIDTAIENSQRMVQMVRDLLAFSRALEPGDAAPRIADAARTFAVVMKNLESAVLETKADITCGPLPVVEIPEIHLSQLLQNLIGNSLKYHGGRPPKISVSAMPAEDRYSIFAIRDNGIGIPDEFHSRVFGIFKRLDKDKVSGSGIGLALCKRIVEHYGGKIWIKSNQDKGVTFFFSIPAASGTSNGYIDASDMA